MFLDLKKMTESSLGFVEVDVGNTDLLQNQQIFTNFKKIRFFQKRLIVSTQGRTEDLQRVKPT